MKQGPKSHPPRSARLFSEASQPTDVYIAHIDGAARGNPGPASYGVIIRRPDGQPLASLGKYLGRATNNVAEYYALIAALDYASAHGIRKLRVRSDSRSEEHTSELQSQSNLVCRLLLEKKKKSNHKHTSLYSTLTVG